jgi:hypothetical protein
MQTHAQTTPASKKLLWPGLIISAIPVLFMLFDSIIKIIKIGPVVESFAQLGYPVDLARSIGIVELLCVIIYMIPRSAVLGAILLTGFLGGATAVKLRFEDPWFLFSVGIGVLVWLGLFLRDDRLRILIPLRK